MSTRLYTIGYQGASIEDFIAALKAAGVETLIDVRAASASRRREFSKRNLAASLEAAGLTYVHLGGLGNPKGGREAAKAGLHNKDKLLTRVATCDSSSYGTSGKQAIAARISDNRL